MTTHYQNSRRGPLQCSGLVLILSFYPYEYPYPSQPTPQVKPFHSPSCPSLPILSLAAGRLGRLKHTPNHIKQKRPATIKRVGFNTSYLQPVRVPLPNSTHTPGQPQVNPFNSLLMSIAPHHALFWIFCLSVSQYRSSPKRVRIIIS